MKPVHKPGAHDTRLAELTLREISDALATRDETIADMSVVIDMVAGKGTIFCEPGANCR